MGNWSHASAALAAEHGHWLQLQDSRGVYAENPPGYAWFLGLVYTTLGHSALAVGIAQALVAAVTCVWVVSLGRSVGGDLAATIAGLGLALYPYAVAQSVSMSDTVLFTLALVAAVGATYSVDEKPSAARGLVAGAAWGASALVRATGLVLIPGVVLLVALRTKAGFKGAGTLLAGAAMVVGLWTLRNAILTHHFLLIDDKGVEQVYRGNNPETLRYLQDDVTLDDLALELPRPPPEEESPSWYWERVIEFWREAPVLALHTTWEKVCVLWSWRLRPQPDRVLLASQRFRNSAYTLSYVPVLLLALMGGWRLRRTFYAQMVAVLAAELTVLHAFTTATSRHRLPLDALFIVLAAVEVSARWQAYRARSAAAPSVVSVRNSA